VVGQRAVRPDLVVVLAAATGRLVHPNVVLGPSLLSCRMARKQAKQTRRAAANGGATESSFRCPDGKCELWMLMAVLDEGTTEGKEATAA